MTTPSFSQPISLLLIQVHVTFAKKNPLIFLIRTTGNERTRIFRVKIEKKIQSCCSYRLCIFLIFKVTPFLGWCAYIKQKVCLI